MLKRTCFLACVLFAFTTVVASQDLRHVDFKNYLYPWNRPPGWSDHLEWPDPHGRKTVRLIGGHWSDQTEVDERAEGSLPIPGLTFESVEFGDVTGAGQEDAIVATRYDSGGTQFSYFVYIYSSVEGRPTLLAYFHAGDRAYSGLYKVYAQKQQLVIELFDPNKRTGDCCSSGFIRTRYRWEDGRFKIAGPREFGRPAVSSRIPVSPFGLHQ